MTRHEPAKADPKPRDPRRDQNKNKGDQPARGGDWADEAARARTADDPRAVTPHDPTGVPSTGDDR
ncbi:hypothetical protein ACFFWC_16455 [Plantactinospora siamensis]|uniref:Uncharacterized protein n=1 Tax=Plantactinospora siamensis TaxID=555372 RepID=A0ABV6NXG3_9ACTN